MCCCVIGLRREGRRCAPLMLPGTGDRSPARRGAGGERGRAPLHPLATPVHPAAPGFGRNRACRAYPVRRASQGAAARTFPALWAGRCSRLLRRSVRPAGVRDRLRARAALLCPRHRAHPSLTYRLPSAGIAGTSGGRRFRKRAFILEKEKCEAAAQCRPAQSERKNCVFSRNDRP